MNITVLTRTQMDQLGGSCILIINLTWLLGVRMRYTKNPRNAPSVITNTAWCDLLLNGPLARYVRLWVEHSPGMPGTLFPRVSHRDMHHGTCVTHVPWCIPGSLTSGFLWSQWREKRSRHSRRMRNPQFYASGKRPIKGRLCIMIFYAFFWRVCSYSFVGSSYHVQLYIVWGITFSATRRVQLRWYHRLKAAHCRRTTHG